jgi:methionine-rich copper-binding protein CopC/putative copper export protein
MLVALVALLLAAPVATAQAHAFLVSSNPADGQVLDSAPRVLRLDFSESVVVDATRLDVVDGLGHHYVATDLHLLGDAGAAEGDGDVDTEEPVQLQAQLPALGRGTYRVSWETLSRDDLHRASGVLAFGIGEPVGAVGSVDESAAPGEAGARWVLWACLAGVFGALAVAALAGQTLTGRRRERLVRFGRWSAIGLVAATLVLPVAQLRSLRQVLLATESVAVGVPWVGRVVAASCVAFLVAAGVRLLTAGEGLRHVVRRHLAGSALLGAGLILVPVLSALRSHLGASGSTVLVLADVVHTTAAATWAGAVVALAVVRLGRGARPSVPVRPFAVLSLTCLTVAVGSGLVLAGNGVATTTALLHAAYGREILLKAALIVAVLGLACVNHLRGRRQGTAGGHTRPWVLVEAMALVAVLGAGGLVAATAPASSPRWTPAPMPSRAVALHVDDLLVEMSVGPNAPGPAFVDVRVLQTRRPVPAPVREVRVTMHRSGATDVGGAALQQADGSWTLPVQLDEPGRWRATVSADRMGLPLATADLQCVVAGGVHGPAGPRLSTFTSPLAVLVLILGMVALLVLVRAHGLPRRQPRANLLATVRVEAGRADGRTTSCVSSVVVLLLLSSVWTSGPPGGRTPGASRTPPPAAPSSPSSPSLPKSADVIEAEPLPAAGVASATSWPSRTTPVQPVVSGPPQAKVDGIDRSSQLWDLPGALVRAYRAAAAGARPGCHLPVSLLAAIGQVESGSLAGRRLDAQNRVVPPVLGPVLDGRGTAAIHDSDGGALDGSSRWDRAVGPMQFIPGTWAVYGRDADRDGRADPQDVDDAAASAATYLCGERRDLALAEDLRAAVLAYNHSAQYLTLVLRWQRRFAADGVRSVPAPSVVRPVVAAVPVAPTRTTTPVAVTPTPSPVVTRPAPAPVTPTTAPAPVTSTSPSPTDPPVDLLPSSVGVPDPSAPEPTVEPPTSPTAAATPSGAPTETASPTQTPCTATTSLPPTVVPTPDPTSAPGSTDQPPSVPAPTDVAGGCVPAQPTGMPAPPVSSLPPGEPVPPSPPPPTGTASSTEPVTSSGT